MTLPVEREPTSEELIELGNRYDLEGRWDEAIDAYSQAIKLARLKEEKHTIAEALRLTGNMQFKKNEWGDALQSFQKSLEHFQSLKASRGTAYSMNSIGNIYLEKGEWELAKKYYLKSLALARRIRDFKMEGMIYNNLGVMAMFQGLIQQAIARYQRSLFYYEKAGYKKGMGETYLNIGICHTNLGDFEKSDEFHRKTLEIAQELGDVYLQSKIYLHWTEVALEMANLDFARELCDQAFEFSSQLKDQLDIAQAFQHYGKIYRMMRKFALSKKHFEESIKICQQYDGLQVLAEDYRELALLYRDQEDNRNALELLGQSFELFHQLKARKDVRDVNQKIEELEMIYVNTAKSMGAAVEIKDTYTFGHSKRVAYYALQLSRKLNLSLSQIKAILTAAFLHDLGKVKIKRRILLKNGRLTPLEYEAIKLHSALGVRMIDTLNFPWDIKPLILHHHEKYDGTGYPNGLKGEKIPLGARIIGIADFFDALTTVRPYRPAWSVADTIEEMNDQMNGAFDPQLIPVFVELVKDIIPNQNVETLTFETDFSDLWSTTSSVID